MNFILPVIVVVLVVLQAVYLPPSLSQTRPEELSESIRNVYWYDLGHHIPYTNPVPGYYLPHLILYKVFGFNFLLPKLFRLGLQVLSLTCLAVLLHRFLGSKKAAIPLLTIGLSPTLLFFNTLSTPYGIDLQYIPILIYLALHKSRLALVGFWFVMAVFYNSYAGSLNLIPALILLFLMKSPHWRSQKIQTILISLVTLALSFFLLFFKYGSFPPPVGAGKFQFIPKQAISTFLGLGGLPDNYYYEVAKADFSDIYPYLSLLAAIFCIAVSLKNKRHKTALLICVSAILVNFAILATFTSTVGDVNVRRASGFIAGVYGLYVLAWTDLPAIKNKILRISLLILLLLLPLHHLLSYLPNYHNLTTPSPHQEEFWFHRFGPPEQSLQVYTNKITLSDLKLRQDYSDIDFIYIYSWAYSAISASCHWNHLDCKNLYGYDPTQQKYLLLDFPTMHTMLTDYHTPR